MTADTRLTMPRGAAALVAIALLAAGAGATYLLTRGDVGTGRHPGDVRSDEGAQSTATVPADASNAPLSDVVVPLSQDAVERAGILVAPVASGTSATEIRLPGVVEPNAYRQVVVTPLVAGRVMKIGPALGDRVRRGQTLAEIYSPALAEAQTRYVSAQAMLDAHDRELQRTEKLVEIGAASRQELEKIHAEHAAQTATVQSARSELELLGVSGSALDHMASGHGVSAATSVPAPIDGVITERGANVGLNVDPATKLFTVVDLSTVWVVADLYEKDFSRVRVGSVAAITTSARPDLTLRGRVSYIDPQVRADTRTAQVRIEVPNPGRELRLGMYADVVVSGAPGTSAPGVPRAAVQNVGDRTVVYLVNPKEPGRFVEREVHLGAVSGEQVEVVSGVEPGDVVVTDGSFFVRAERERLGLRPAAGAANASATPTSSSAGRGSEATSVDITFRPLNDPPKTGDNLFEVAVKDPTGKPVMDADVSVTLFMPAVPTMNMPAMRNETKLPPVGSGVYRGPGQLMMAGRWDATVTVTKAGQRLASKQFAVVAK